MTLYLTYTDHMYWWRAWQDRRLARAGRLPMQVAAVAEAPSASGAPEAGAGTDGRAEPVASAELSGEPPVTQ